MNKNQICNINTSQTIHLFDVQMRVSTLNKESGRCEFHITRWMSNKHHFQDSFDVTLLHRDEVLAEENPWNYCVAVSPESVLLSTTPIVITEALIIFEAMYRMRRAHLEGVKYTTGYGSDQPINLIEVRLSEDTGCVFLCNFLQEIITSEVKTNE